MRFTSFTMVPQCSSQVWPDAVLQQRCLRIESARVCLGFHHEVVRKSKHCHRDRIGPDPRLCSNGHFDALSHGTHRRTEKDGHTRLRCCQNFQSRGSQRQAGKARLSHRVKSECTNPYTSEKGTALSGKIAASEGLDSLHTTTFSVFREQVFTTNINREKERNYNIRHSGD